MLLHVAAHLNTAKAYSVQKIRALCLQCLMYDELFINDGVIVFLSLYDV